MFEGAVLATYWDLMYGFWYDNLGISMKRNLPSERRYSKVSGVFIIGTVGVLFIVLDLTLLSQLEIVHERFNHEVENFWGNNT